MRSLTAGLAGALLLAITGCGDEGPAGADEPLTAEQCRSQWADLGQLHGENGNPEGPVPALSRRWETVDRDADRLARTATGDDCGTRIEDFADAWGALESFQYDLYAFDPAADLARAEADRRHYQGLHDPGEPPNQLSLQLARAFRTVRRQTPPAIEDLAPALAGAADLDLEDPDAVRAFLRDAHGVKRESSHVRRMRPAYRVIGNAELDEE